LDVSKQQLKDVYTKFEPKYGKLADEIYSEYESLLQRELQAGVRTSEDLANFAKTNPFFTPDKALDIEEMLKM